MSSLTRYWYLLIEVSPGSVQPNLVSLSPAVAVKPAGLNGGVRGVPITWPATPSVVPRAARISMV